MTQPRRPERLISPSTTRTRSDMYIDTNTRYPQRIPRLIRRPPPSAITTTELDHRPGSISSAISMTREYAIRSDNYQIGPTAVNDLHCTFDEKAVDLSLIREIQIEERPNNRNYVPLKFEICVEDGGRYSATYRIENVLKNDGSVYCSQRYGTVNILMRYNGGENKSTCCSLSHIIIKSPEHG